MAENKTQATRASVTEFVNGIGDTQKRADCKAIAAMMRKATGRQPKMWGSSIVGYGNYHYKYESGREGDFFLCGWSPRARNISVYIMPGFSGFDALMKKLGKYKTGKSCLYINRLDDVDRDVLRRLIEESVAEMRRRYDG